MHTILGALWRAPRRCSVLALRVAGGAVHGHLCWEAGEDDTG